MVSPKTKIELPNNSTLECITPQNKKPLLEKDTCTQIFTVELFTVAKIWKQTKCTYIYTQCTTTQS